MQKTLALALGTVLVLMGVVFTLQGLGYLAGSAMTGVTTWAIVGPILVVVGLVLLVRAGRRRPPG
ncbi:hypothetical protein [Pengzhenrongella sp.]|uniref:hypothetical protein n=1 Tax=Pengzhenrongella sp. TaxID=2888820 RepID=UPI002F92EB5D